MSDLNMLRLIQNEVKQAEAEAEAETDLLTYEAVPGLQYALIGSDGFMHSMARRQGEGIKRLKPSKGGRYSVATTDHEEVNGTVEQFRAVRRGELKLQSLIVHRVGDRAGGIPKDSQETPMADVLEPQGDAGEQARGETPDEAAVARSLVGRATDQPEAEEKMDLYRIVLVHDDGSRFVESHTRLTTRERAEQNAAELADENPQVDVVVERAVHHPVATYRSEGARKIA